MGSALWFKHIVQMPVFATAAASQDVAWFGDSYMVPLTDPARFVQMHADYGLAASANVPAGVSDLVANATSTTGLYVDVRLQSVTAPFLMYTSWYDAVQAKYMAMLNLDLGAAVAFQTEKELFASQHTLNSVAFNAVSLM